MATTTTHTHSHTAIGIFRDRAEVEKTLNDLMAAGLPRDHISVIANDKGAEARMTDTPNLLPNEQIGGSETNAGGNAAVGGFLGFMAGMAALAIPGVGPIIAVGPIAAGLMGAGVGAAAGGLIGGLRDLNVPENHAEKYAEAIRNGNILVAAHASDKLADKAAEIMDFNGAIDSDEGKNLQVPVPSRDAQPIGTVTDAGVRAARLDADSSVREGQRQNERRASVFPGITGSGDSTGNV